MRAVPAEIEHQIGANVPGLVLAIVQRDELVVSEAWGVADIRSGAPMTPDTACNWFSMTKPATATLAFQLAEQRLLDLDAPVQDYYQPFTFTHPARDQRRPQFDISCGS